jgi:signal peptidase I
MSFFENRKRKKIRNIVNFIKKFFAKYEGKYSDNSLKPINKQIKEVESLIDDGDLSMLESKTKALIESFEEKKRVVKSKPREFIEALIIALILALVIREFVVQAFKIPSQSMEKTLLVGDHILVWKCYYGVRIPYTRDWLIQFNHPKRGEIIVFTPPRDPTKDFIKRVIGVSGDTLEMVNDQVYVNGTAIPEPYVNPPGHPYKYANFQPTKISDGMLFVMGDNRANSSDSRDWGMLPEKNIKGKAFIIYFPWITGEEMKQSGISPYNIFLRLRWARFFHLIH